MDMKISIKGIIISVVSALAGATLIAFGGYYAGRHRKNVQLQPEINRLSNEKKKVQAYNDKLLIQVYNLEKQNKDLNEKGNVEKVKELEEKCKQLNEQLNNEKQINDEMKNRVSELKNQVDESIKLIKAFKEHMKYSNE